jgi:hypothetical protein
LGAWTMRASAYASAEGAAAAPAARATAPPVRAAKDFYTKSILDFIDDPQTANLRLITESPAIFVDEFKTGEVDSADMLKEPTDLFHVDLFQVLTERFATPDYEKVVAGEKNDATHDINNADQDVIDRDLDDIIYEAERLKESRKISTLPQRQKSRGSLPT